MAGKPTHRLLMKVKREDRSGDYAEVGAAWLSASGAISLKLNVGVTLSWRDREDTILTLFPENAPDEGPKPAGEENGPPCPKCSGPTAARDASEGGWFWGCRSFPRCKGTLSPTRGG